MKTLSNLQRQHSQRQCHIMAQSTDHQTKNDPRRNRLTLSSQYLFRCNCGALEWVAVDDPALLMNLKKLFGIGEQK
jgi:hypothetical protein